MRSSAARVTRTTGEVMNKSIMPKLNEDIALSRRVVAGALATGLALGLRTTFELGDQIAKRLFDSRSKARGPRNVEVHVSEGELRDLLAGAAELARIGYEKKRVLPVDRLAAVAHARWVQHMRDSGITSRRSEAGEETMVPFDQLSETEKAQPRAVVRAIIEEIG